MKMNFIENWMVNRSVTGKSGEKLAKKQLSNAELESTTNFMDIRRGRGEITRFVAKNYQGEFFGIDTDADELDIAKSKSDS